MSEAPAATMRLAVVGGGWAGIAAAVRAVQSGWKVSLFDMAPQLGGRARTVTTAGESLDNGQHILIGAYTRTLDLMCTLGVDPSMSLLRVPLSLTHADGRGLALRAGAAVPALVVAVLRCQGMPVSARLGLLAAASTWAMRGFSCPSHWSVAELCRGMSPHTRALLIDPLCVAALNTPAHEASATVFLRVLRDALFSGAGSSDLLLPRRPLGELLPEPAVRWLGQHGAQVLTGRRVRQLAQGGSGWCLDGQDFDAVVLACSAQEAARLVGTGAPHHEAWALAARTMSYEPIVTVYVRAPGARLPSPMLALLDDAEAPAQFVFDHGAISHRHDLLACVVSGAARWVERGLPETASATVRQLQTQLAPWLGSGSPEVVHASAEKRATFRCVPLLKRPAAVVSPGLVAAGDYVQGPYPATLEGAVRAGEEAVLALRAWSGSLR